MSTDIHLSCREGEERESFEVLSLSFFHLCRCQEQSKVSEYFCMRAKVFWNIHTHTEHMIEWEQENKRTRKVEEEALSQNPFPWPQARDDEGDVVLAKLILVYAFNNLL